jgi:quercetin dioxygenase-like cupin family protein
MGHTAVDDVKATVTIQPGSVVSKVIYRDDRLNVTVFGLDAGEELTEHTASRSALVEVVSGRLRFTVDGQEHEAGPGFWLRMEEGAPHSLVAVEPSVMLLTLIA